MGWLARAQRRWRDWRSPPLGRRGERVAARYLRRKGYTIVGRGERNRLGELDLVAVEGRTLVFVEVKTRSSADAGRPVEAVTTDKQARLARLAVEYLKRHNLLGHSARFDVVAVTWPSGARQPTIEHFPNAFEPPGKGQMFS